MKTLKIVLIAYEKLTGPIQSSILSSPGKEDRLLCTNCFHFDVGFVQTTHFQLVFLLFFSFNCMIPLYIYIDSQSLYNELNVFNFAQVTSTSTSTDLISGA